MVEALPPPVRAAVSTLSAPGRGVAALSASGGAEASASVGATVGAGTITRPAGFCHSDHVHASATAAISSASAIRYTLR